MKLKFIGGLFLISLLLFFLYQHGFLRFDFKEFPFRIIGRFYEIIENLIFPPGKKFRIFANLTLDSFYEQKIDIFNSVIIADGICESLILDGIAIGKKGNCSIYTFGKTGKIFVSEFLDFEIVSDSIVFNEVPYVGKDMKINFKIQPLSIFVENFEKNILLQKAFGEIRKLRDDGSLDQLKFVNGERAEIRNFAGNLKINKYLILSGTSTEVRGETFGFK